MSRITYEFLICKPYENLSKCWAAENTDRIVLHKEKQSEDQGFI